MIYEELMLKIDNVSKVYRLGEIGGTTLRDELQRLWAKMRRKEDPTKKIGAKNFNKGQKFKALDSVSFEVKKGERIGVIGRNGAGKSTLLKLISRVTGPTGGQIYLNGRVASMLEVGTGFNPELTGRENVYMNGAILGMTKKEIDAKMEDIIEFSEVRQFIDTPVKRYSSGMYVKLAFSVAAHLNSEIMIMDEVLAVGDLAFQNKCLQKMKDVSEDDDRTILYVSHNMATIRQLCNRVIVLDKGKIIFDGDVEEGIAIYFNGDFDQASYLNLETYKRHKHVTRKIVVSSTEFLGRDKSVFSDEEDIILGIRWSSKANLSNLMFRYSLRNGSDIPIGTSTIQLGDAVDNEHRLLKLILEKRFLAPGDYYVNFEFYQLDNANNSVCHDQILKSTRFQVVSDKIVWRQDWWGNIQNIPLTIDDGYEKK